MRERGEIVGDGLEAVKSATVLTKSDLKLKLLELEALVDIRDVLEQRLASLDNTILKNIKPWK